MSLQPVSGVPKITPESNLYLDVTKEGSDLPGLSQFSVVGPDLKQLQNGYNYTATAHPRASSKDDDDKKKDDDKKSDDKKDDDRKPTPSRPESSSKSSEPKTQEKPSAAKSSSEKDDTVKVPVKHDHDGREEAGGQPSYVEIGGKQYPVKHDQDDDRFLEVPKNPNAKSESERTTRYPVYTERDGCLGSDDCMPGQTREVVSIPQSEVDKLEEENKAKDD